MFLTELLASSFRMGVPILLVSLGAYFLGPVSGFLLAAVAGLVLALIHALATVTFRVEHVVSGVALNILAYGSSRFMSQAIFKMATTSPHVPGLPKINIPGLSNIAAVAPLVTDVSPIIILAVLLVPITNFVLNRTVFGLRLRAVGENPLAVDTLGIDVYRLKYAGVLVSGALAGIAGAYLAVEHTGLYVEGMTQVGFIALAAMIFGNWSPKALWAALLFGFAEALSFRWWSAIIPYQFIKMLPYVLTVLVLAGVVRRSEPPAAVGIPYERNAG